jgi:hypothetical protein
VFRYVVREAKADEMNSENSATTTKANQKKKKNERRD